MTMKLKSALGASILAAAVAMPAMASNLYGGGASFPFIPYVGGVQAPGVPAAGSMFDTFGAIFSNNLTYCSGGSGFGKSVQRALIPANGACQPSLAGFSGANLRPNFAGTDSPYTQSEYNQFVTNLPSKTALVQVPVMLGAVVVPFKHPSVSTNITLTAAQLCSIYNGSVTNWSGVGLPAAPINFAYRGSSSGTTFSFALFMAKTCNPGKPVSAPVIRAEQLYTSSNLPTAGAVVIPPAVDNADLVAKVNATNGAIGYADPSDVVAQGGTYIRVNGIDPISTPFASPTFTAADLEVDNVITGTDPATGLPTFTPASTALQSILMVKPTASATTTYPIFAVTYLATYARGNDAADVGSDALAYTQLQQLLSCFTDNSLSATCFGAPPSGFATINFNAAAIAPTTGVVWKAIDQVRN